MAELERVGGRLGAKRRPEHTLHEYARVLEAAGVPAVPLKRIVTALEVESFSGASLDARERDEVDTFLSALSSGR
jgi:hypothetical protein